MSMKGRRRPRSRLSAPSRTSVELRPRPNSPRPAKARKATAATGRAESTDASRFLRSYFDRGRAVGAGAEGAAGSEGSPGSGHRRRPRFTTGRRTVAPRIASENAVRVKMMAMEPVILQSRWVTHRAETAWCPRREGRSRCRALPACSRTRWRSLDGRSEAISDGTSVRARDTYNPWWRPARRFVHDGDENPCAFRLGEPTARRRSALGPSAPSCPPSRLPP